MDTKTLTDTVTIVKQEGDWILTLPGVGVTLAFRGGSVGVEGARRLHVGHIHVMQGKVHPQRALWPQNAPSPGAAGVAKRGF